MMRASCQSLLKRRSRPGFWGTAWGAGGEPQRVRGSHPDAGNTKSDTHQTSCTFSHSHSKKKSHEIAKAKRGRSCDRGVPPAKNPPIHFHGLTHPFTHGQVVQCSEFGPHGLFQMFFFYNKHRLSSFLLDALNLARVLELP